MIKSPVSSVTALADNEKSSLPRCPLCRNGHWTPPIKVLDCGHSFCQQCLKAIVEKRRRAGKYLRNYSLIKCPACHEEKKSSWNDVEGLPTNFDLQHFFDILFAKTGQPLRTERPDPQDDTISDVSISSSESNSESTFNHTVWLGPYRSCRSVEDADDNDGNVIGSAVSSHTADSVNPSDGEHENLVQLEENESGSDWVDL